MHNLTSHTARQHSTIHKCQHQHQLWLGSTYVQCTTLRLQQHTGRRLVIRTLLHDLDFTGQDIYSVLLSQACGEGELVSVHCLVEHCVYCCLGYCVLFDWDFRTSSRPSPPQLPLFYPPIFLSSSTQGARKLTSGPAMPPHSRLLEPSQQTMLRRQHPPPHPRPHKHN